MMGRPGLRLKKVAILQVKTAAHMTILVRGKEELATTRPLQAKPRGKIRGLS